MNIKSIKNNILSILVFLPFILLTISLHHVHACQPIVVQVQNQGTLNLCQGRTTILLADSGYTSYLWNTGATTSSIQVSQAGTYQVTVMDGNGCSGTSSVLTVTSVTLQTGSNSPICEGDQLLLSSTVISGGQYVWSGPGGYSSSQVNPSIQNTSLSRSGIYTLMVSVSGCQNMLTGTVSVQINSRPSNISLVPNTPVCFGGTIQLSASGGTTGLTINWLAPDGYTGTGISISRNNATAPMGGLYSATMSSAGCLSMTQTTTIMVLDTTVQATSSGTICEGSPLYLNSVGPQGSSYAWSGPNGFTSTQINPSINTSTLSATGTYSVTVTHPTCGVRSSTVSALVQRRVTGLSRGSNSPVCIGTDLILTATRHLDLNYVWRGPGGFSAQGDSLSRSNMSIGMAGQYSLSVSNQACGTANYVTTVTSLDPVVTISTTSPVCAGNSVYLNATGGNTTTWQGPNGFSYNGRSTTLINVQPVQSGTYIARDSNKCGVYADTLQLQVGQVLSGFRIVSNSPVCVGLNLNLSITPSIIGTGTIQWSGPRGILGTTPSIALSNLTQSDNGQYSLTISTPGCGSRSISTGVTINNSVVTTTVNSPVCSEVPLYFTASSHTGATYAWTGPSGFTSQRQNPSINRSNSSNSGIYNLSVTIPGCGTVSRQVTVVVQQRPVVSATTNSPVCEGNVLSMNQALVQGVSITWNGPGGYSASGESVSRANVNPTFSGIYTVTASTAGCGTVTKSISVVIGANAQGAVISSNSPICAGSVLNLTSTRYSGAQYAWSGPESFVSNQVAPSRTSMTSGRAGVYTLQITTPGCSPVVKTTSVVVNTTPVPSPGSNSPVCQGNVLTLTAAVQTNVSYAWSGPSGYTATGQSATIASVQPIRSGIYTVVASIPGCPSVTSQTIVVVSISPSSATAGTNSPICVAGNLILTTSSFPSATYLWSGPGGFTSDQRTVVRSNVNTGAAGIYTVQVGTPGCISAERNVSVVINSPAVVTPGSNSPVCAGSNLILSNPNNTNTTYTWAGPNSFTSTNQNPTLSSAQSLQAGVYTLTATSAGCSPISGTTTVVIGSSQSSVAATSNSPICEGNTLQFSVASVGNGSYLWEGPSGYSASGSTASLPLATALNSGQYTLTASAPGCSPVLRQLTVVVNSNPIVTPGSNSPVCAGSNLVLSNPNNTNTTYIWAGPNSFTSTNQNPTLSSAQTLQAGVYTLTATAAGCSPISGTTTVVIGASQSSVAATSNSPICAGNTLQFSLASIGNGSYLWEGPSGYSASGSTASLPLATALNSGQYTLTATSPGCSPVLRQLTVLVNSNPIVTPGSNSPVCQGASLQLSTSNNTNTVYAWSGPNGFTSSSQNPTIAGVTSLQTGIYTLLVTTSGCPPVTSTTSVAVGASQSAVSVVTNSPVCAGNTLSLSVAAIGNGTYLWEGPSSYSNTGNAISILGATSSNAGQYTLTATSPGCAAVTRNATVVVNNTAVSNPGSNSPICAGNVLTLTASTQSSATYAWSGPGGYTSNTQNPTRSNAQQAMSGVYTLTVTITGCGSSTGTHTVTISPSVSSASTSITSPICEGSTLGLSATSFTGVTYSWTGPQGFTASTVTASIPNAQTNNSGVYSLTISSPGCPSFSGTRTAVVQGQSSVTASVGTPVCRGNAVFFTGTAPSGSTYRWDGPNGYSSSLQNPSLSNVQLNQAGTYTLTATTTGCGAIQKTATLVVNSCRMASTNDPLESIPQEINSYEEVMDKTSTGHIESMSLEVEVYPVPFKDNLEWRSTTGEEITWTELWNVQGICVLKESPQYRLAGKLETSSISPGVYFFRVVSGDESKTYQVIKY